MWYVRLVVDTVVFTVRVTTSTAVAVAVKVSVAVAVTVGAEVSARKPMTGSCVESGRRRVYVISPRVRVMKSLWKQKLLA